MAGRKLSGLGKLGLNFGLKISDFRLSSLMNLQFEIYNL